MKKVLLSWSSGKDSAWALHLLRQQPDIQVVALVTTFNSAANRVAMHAIRRALVEAQAERTATALKGKGYDYRFVYSRATRHCDAKVFGQTLADTLVWMWRGYHAE